MTKTLSFIILWLLAAPIAAVAQWSGTPTKVEAYKAPNGQRGVKLTYESKTDFLPDRRFLELQGDVQTCWWQDGDNAPVLYTFSKYHTLMSAAYADGSGDVMPGLKRDNRARIVTYGSDEPNEMDGEVYKTSIAWSAVPDADGYPATISEPNPEGDVVTQLTFNRSLPGKAPHLTKKTIKATGMNYGGTVTYSDYVFDGQGNWTSRKAAYNLVCRADGNAPLRYTEKQQRRITYFSRTDDVPKDSIVRDTIVKDTLIRDTLVKDTLPCVHNWQLEDIFVRHEVDDSRCPKVEYDVFREVATCTRCGRKQEFFPVTNNYKSELCLLGHRWEEKSRVVLDTIAFLQGNCTERYVRYQVDYACQVCCKTTGNTQSELLGTSCPPVETCPPHVYPDDEMQKIYQTVEARTVNGQTCYYYYDVMQRLRPCQRCHQLPPPVRQFNRRDCSPVPPHRSQCPPHDWEYAHYRHNDAVTAEKNTALYAEDSLNVLLDAEAHTWLKMLKVGRGTDARFFSATPATVAQWMAVYRDADDLRLPKDDKGQLRAIGYDDACDFITLLNDSVQQKSNANVLLTMPSATEMMAMVTFVKQGFFGPQAQRMKQFWVDSVEVSDERGRLLTNQQLSQLPSNSELTIRVGVVDIDGQLRMVDISQAPAQGTCFFIKATPYTMPYIETRGRHYRLYKRVCKKCFKEEVISQRRYFDRKPVITTAGEPAAQAVAADEPLPKGVIELCAYLLELDDADLVQQRLERELGFHFEKEVLGSGMEGWSRQYEGFEIVIKRKKKKQPELKYIELKVRDEAYDLRQELRKAGYSMLPSDLSGNYLYKGRQQAFNFTYTHEGKQVGVCQFSKTK